MTEPPDRELALFTAARQLPVAQRAAYLEQACADDAALRQRVAELLRMGEHTGGFLESPAGVSPGPGGTVRASFLSIEKVGDRIGRYKLLQQIGEGGCGVVYMAEQQEPVRRRVALKVIKLGMDTKEVVGRFEAERQALALMDHPNIAKVLDAGATDQGRPYFVMELVRGIKITDYCDQNNLSTRQRLDLFIQICHAIQHAHQKGIIHRDIKPSNILVTMSDGVPLPKVIDFGIAKATHGKLTDQTVFTAFEQFIGTPAYMSPEQAEMSALDIDTRSDIYSLGVLLYELLTGQTPFDAKDLLQAGLQEIRRTIREEEPARPSTRLSTMVGAALALVARQRKVEPVGLIHLVRGDLDWIVMKALEKDRTRRYETASGFAADVQRHLGNEPVAARPPSNVYRFQKMARRNRLAFVAAAAVALALLAGMSVSVWQAVRATRAETLAKERLADSAALSTFMTEVFQNPDPERDGHRITVAEILDAAAQKLETQLTSQPMRRAKFQSTLGLSYQAVGLYGEAVPLQEHVRDYYLAACGPGFPNTIDAMNDLALSYEEIGRLEEARKLVEDVVAICRKVRGREDPVTLEAMHNLAIFYVDIGRPNDALKLREEVLALRRKVLGSEHPDTIQAMERMAYSYDHAGRRDEALKLREHVLAFNIKQREEALTLSRKINGPAHPDTLRAMRNLADVYCAIGRDHEAIALLEEAREAGPTDTGTLMTLAIWQVWGGHEADYEATRRTLIRQVEETAQASLAERVAKIYCLRPSTDAVLLTKVLNLAQRAVALGKTDSWLSWDNLALGLAQYRNGQYGNAERTLASIEPTKVGKRPDVRGTARLFRAMSLFPQNRAEEGRKLFRQAEAEMPPLPKDARKPFADGRPINHDVLFCWLAYKEAKSLLNATAVKP